MKKTKYPGVYRLPDGRYHLDATGWCPKTGKRKRKRKDVEAASAAEANRMRAELRAKIERGSPEANARERLAPAARSWLTGKLAELKASTRRHYADVLDLHVFPVLGDHYLDAITTADIVGWRDALVGRPATINSRLRVFKTVLADLTHERSIHNPAARVRSVREGRRETPKGLEPAELGLVLEQLRISWPQWYPIGLTLALTGARWGEVAALRWTDIDEQTAVIRIARAHVRGTVDTTKTEVVKEVPLVPELLAVLKAHRVELVKSQAKGLEAGWVFPSTVGTLMQPSSFRKPLARACEAAKVRTISPHGLRYSFNHAAKRTTTRDVVRSITGHVTEEMTTHYDWIRNDEKHRAVAGVLQLVTPKPEANGCDSPCDTRTDKEERPAEEATSTGRKN